MEKALSAMERDCSRDLNNGSPLLGILSERSRLIWTSSNFGGRNRQEFGCSLQDAEGGNLRVAESNKSCVNTLSASIHASPPIVLPAGTDRLSL